MIEKLLEFIGRRRVVNGPRYRFETTIEEMGLDRDAVDAYLEDLSRRTRERMTWSGSYY